MFRCRDLLSLSTMTRAKLIAGEKGLENGIRWSYKAEGMNFAPWVHGQELLVVSTSIISSSDFELHTLIETAIRLKLSGVLLLVGEEYISSISKKSLSLADQHGLPIIGLPGEIPLVDFFEELGHAIVFQEKKQNMYDDILAGIVFGNQIDPVMLDRQTKLLGYEMKGKQRGFMIRIVLPEDETAMEYMSRYLEKLHSFFGQSESTAMISHFHTNLIGITGEEDESKLDHIWEQFYGYVMKQDSGVSCQIGVGGAYENPEMLSQSFSEASAVMQLSYSIQWYERLGFLKLLLNAESQKQVTEYIRQILGKVIDHDQANDSQLLDTLIAYFDCNENMKEAGAMIYVHPNTVKYRLQQIQELSGLSLFTTGEKVELYNALQCWKIMEKGKYSLTRI